jgi:hypothetical protein
MSTFHVKKVRKETVRTTSGATHEHIVGVVTSGGTFYTNQQVTSSLEAKNEWLTDVEGQPKAKIRPLAYCPKSDCYHKPYITTEPDHNTRNNLDNLPPG